MRKIFFWLMAAVIIVGAFVGGRYVTYYRGSYTPLPPPERGEEAGDQYQLPIGGFDEEPVRHRGVLLVDQAHRNDFSNTELNVLLARLKARGYDHEYLTDADELGTRLKYANAMLVIAPDSLFKAEEVDVIEDFLAKGGRLLLISDPTRNSEVKGINSLAGRFGVLFEDDYVYNLVENDNNYRNVILRDFTQDTVTRDLESVAFYSACSLNSPGGALITGDENTLSNLETVGNQPDVAALTYEGQVLALCDLTFLTEPYNAVLDNNRLIASIAKFLSSGDRIFDLSDFPYLFSSNVDIVFGDSFLLNAHFERAVALKDALFAAGHEAIFRDEEDPDTDLIFVGRFKDAERVSDYLETGRISILGVEDEEKRTGAEARATATAINTDSIEEGDEFIKGRIAIEGVGEFEQGGSSLFYLLQEKGRNVLIILSDRHETVEDAFELLDNGEFVECLANPQVAVCQTQEPEEELGPSDRAEKIESILIVSDDDSRETFDGMTSLTSYLAILEDGFRVTTWVASEEEKEKEEEEEKKKEEEEEKEAKTKLTLADLQAVDAVIWTTGDFWDDAPDEEDVAMLESYIKRGGNLLISGGFISFDWDHTSFIKNVLHADYLGFEEQKDIKLVASEHPIARGFEEDVVIEFVTSPADETYTYSPDVIAPLKGAEAIFERGPASESKSEASIIVYQDRRSRVAYVAFPMFLMPEEQQARLVKNIIRWFGMPEPEPKETEEPAKEEEKPGEAEEVINSH